jgi:hypothetical protein
VCVRERETGRERDRERERERERERQRQRQRERRARDKTYHPLRHISKDPLSSGGSSFPHPIFLGPTFHVLSLLNILSNYEFISGLIH